MIVFGYASVDLLAERTHSTVELNEMSVSAFLQARPYMTDRAAESYNNFITAVWALPSYLTSAADYREYLEHCLADPTPAFWLPRGSAAEKVINPVTKALEAARVEIVTGARVASVSCEGRRVTEIELEEGVIDPETGQWRATGEARSDEVDELVLAVPARELSRLVRTGEAGGRIVEFAPETSELSRLSAQPIPMLHLYLTRKLPRLPAEPVGMPGSRLALAFTDISQTWDDDFAGRTVLAVSSSDPYGLPRTSARDDAMAILQELGEYLGYDPGSAWGESATSTGSERGTTRTPMRSCSSTRSARMLGVRRSRCESVANLCFAGDFCRSRVGMTTIESAVTSGLEAAAAIVERHGFGEPVEIAEPRSLPTPLYAWLRYAWAPYAMYAKAWSTGTGFARGVGRRLLDGYRRES